MRTCCCLILAVCTLVGLCARADTIKLKNGTALDGEIVSEDASSLSILLQFAGGTITQTRRIDKADIATVTRWTPEQRAERQATRDYENLQKYQLNPQDSYEIAYYDQVINGVFRAFQKQHPNSPYTSQVAQHIIEWKAERDLVAAGNVKFRGRWSPAAEVAPQIERERGQQLLQQARALISQHRFDTAVQRLQLVVQMDKQPDLVSQAKPLLASTYQSATNLLDRQQRQLAGDISSAQQRVDQARVALSAAEASLRQPAGGNSQSTAQAQTAVTRARDELNAAQAYLAIVKSQLDGMKQKLASLKSPVPAATAPTNVTQVSTAQPAPSPAGESPEVLGGLVTWVKNNWVALAVIAAAILFFISRFLIKD